MFGFGQGNGGITKAHLGTGPIKKATSAPASK